MKNDIKKQIINELNSQGIPDMKFIYSDEAMEVSLELLNELLEKEKENFEKKLKIKDEDINYFTFEEFSILDYYWSLLHHLKNVQTSDKIRKIIEDFEPKIIDFWSYISFNKRYYDMLVYCSDNCKITD